MLTMREKKLVAAFKSKLKRQDNFFESRSFEFLYNCFRTLNLRYKLQRFNEMFQNLV